MTKAVEFKPKAKVWIGLHLQILTFLQILLIGFFGVFIMYVTKATFKFSVKCFHDITSIKDKLEGYPSSLSLHEFITKFISLHSTLAQEPKNLQICGKRVTNLHI